jgi:hypothetical protein
MMVEFFGDSCNGGHELESGGEVAEFQRSMKAPVDH